MRPVVRGRMDIWPGFVDVLAGLLMVVMFLLMIFVISQVFLNDALFGRNKQLEELNTQVLQLSNSLGLEQSRSAALRLDIEELGTRLEASLTQARDLRADLAQRQAQAQADAATIQTQSQELADLQRSITNLQALKDKLEQDLLQRDTDLTAERSASEAQRKALLQVQGQLAALEQAIQALRQQTSELNALLAQSEARNAEQKASILSLGQRLNQALASKVQQLARHRSEFFAQLHTLLSTQKDIRVQGDRFIFQSELLFAPASDHIGASGVRQIRSIAQTLKAVSTNIPADIDWVLRIDGHTDRRPISTPRFPSNWELSSARAIAVARELIKAGIPSNRLAPTGFGSYHPIDARDDEIAYRRNRRIELKITQR